MASWCGEGWREGTELGWVESWCEGWDAGCGESWCESCSEEWWGEWDDLGLGNGVKIEVRSGVRAWGELV